MLTELRGLKTVNGSLALVSATLIRNNDLRGEVR